MKSHQNTFLICLLLAASTLVNAQQADLPARPQKKKEDKIIAVYVPPREAVMLRIQRGGGYQLFGRTHVLGTISFEESGLRYAPYTESPKGYLSQEKFEWWYWYNPMFKELFIPYDNIAKFKSRGGKLETLDGHQYRFASRDIKEIVRKTHVYVASVNSNSEQARLK